MLVEPLPARLLGEPLIPPQHEYAPSHELVGDPLSVVNSNGVFEPVGS